MSLVKCCFDTPELADVIETMIQKCTDPGCKCNNNLLFIYKEIFLLMRTKR